MSVTIAGTASSAVLRPRKAAAADLPDVADTLAFAFHDDPVLTWIIDDVTRRRQLLPGFFAAIAESYLAYEEIYAVGDAASAVVWAPPGAEDDEEFPTVLGEAVDEYAARGRNGKGAGSGRRSLLPCSSATSSSTFGTASR